MAHEGDLSAALGKLSFSSWTKSKIATEHVGGNWISSFNYINQYKLFLKLDLANEESEQRMARLAGFN